MLSKRIAGILKQFPNPEVAFFTTEVLLEHRDSSYLKSGWTWRRFGKSFSEYISPSTGRPEDRYQKFSPNDPIGIIDTVAWVYPSQDGRATLREDLASMNRASLIERARAAASLKDFMAQTLKSGEWYEGRHLNQTYPTEVMSIWVASWVNRWLKAFSSLATLGDLYKHYLAIQRLAEKIGDISDYVANEGVDPAHLTFNQLVYRSNRWHASQRRDEMAAAAPPSERVYDRNEHGIFHLKTPEALTHEGNFMGHCVGTYWRRVQEGDCSIYSVRDMNGQSVATIEVLRDGFVKQIKGPANRPVNKPEICDTVYHFLKDLGATNNTGSCMEPMLEQEDQDEPRENPTAPQRKKRGSVFIKKKYEEIEELARKHFPDRSTHGEGDLCNAINCAIAKALWNVGVSDVVLVNGPVTLSEEAYDATDNITSDVLWHSWLVLANGTVVDFAPDVFFTEDGRQVCIEEYGDGEKTSTSGYSQDLYSDLVARFEPRENPYNWRVSRAAHRWQPRRR